MIRKDTFSQEDSAYFDIVKSVRNKIRKYRYNSVLDCLLRYLNQPISNEPIKDLQALPWVAEKILFWVLSDNKALYNHKHNIAERNLIDVINYSWNSVDKIIAVKFNESSLQLTMRQYLLSQFTYQAGLNSHALSFQIYLIARINSNSRLSSYLNLRAGMSLEQYLKLGLICWSRSNQSQPWISRAYIEKLLPIFSTFELNTFFNSISKTPASLRKSLTQNKIRLNNWYQQAPFYQTPFIQFEDAFVPLGRPSLRRYFENLIYDWLYEENGYCKQDYENFLEGYIGERLQQAKVRFLNEIEIQKIIGSDSRCCDYLLEDESAYILIEVKNKALNDSIPVVAQFDLNIKKFESTLISGQKQLNITLEKCRALSRFREKAFYRLIVTQSELWFRDTGMIDESQNRENPIWIISLQDFDQIVDLVIAGTTTFTDFFRDAKERNQNPETSFFSVGQLLDKHPYNNIGLPEHLSLAFIKMVDSIKNQLVA